MVERLENWDVDRREGFIRFGVPGHKAAQAAEIKKGDLLIFYVSSGISRLADIREATQDGTRKLPLGGNYDAAFPVYVSTKPHLTLERERWVPFRGLVDRLSFTQGRGDWRQIMRTSLRRLNEEDGHLLVHSMKTASTATHLTSA